MAQATQNGLGTEYPHIGQTVIDRICYQVYRLPNNPKCGIEHRFVLVGPRGSHVMVSDYGKAFQLNAVCLGGGASWRIAPRQMRGITRQHLSLFMEAAQ